MSNRCGFGGTVDQKLTEQFYDGCKFLNTHYQSYSAALLK